MLRIMGLVIMALFAGLGMGIASAQPTVNVTRGGIGDVLLDALYDVRPNDILRSDQWQNFFVVENTSGNWTAVHLRFRSWRKSIEIWDHVILLSPRDFFYSVIQRATEAGTTSDGDVYAVGDVIIWSLDAETLQNSGLVYPPTTVWVDTFKTDLLVECGYADDQAEIQAGYVEIIGLWQLSIPAYYSEGTEDTHDINNICGDLFASDASNTGVINVYDILEAGWAWWTSPFNATQTWPLTAAICDDWVSPPTNPPVTALVELGADMFQRTFLDCGNFLAGSLERGDLESGRYEMGSFLAFEDFRTDTAPAAHRDGSGMGAILFPAQMLPRAWAPFTETQPNPYNVGANNVWMPWGWGNPRLQNAYYINESYSNTIGPGLRDGDDSWVNNANCDVGNLPFDVSPFNNIWSLDDVEAVLQSGELWSHYYNNHSSVDYWSDLVLTFPTKHYHWGFQFFPWWNDGGVPDRCPGDTRPLYEHDVLYWDIYLSRVQGFRAEMADYLASVENGLIGAHRRIWNSEQDLSDPGPPLPSPLPPDYDPPIPHEVNMISIGDDTSRPDYGKGIHEGDPLMSTTFEEGQFTIGPFWLRMGERNYGFYAAGPIHPIYCWLNPFQESQYLLPSIGEIIFTHAYSGYDVAIRSSATRVKSDHVHELDGMYDWPACQVMKGDERE